MAAIPRLAPPQVDKPAVWPFHKCEWKSLPAHLLLKGERRMEAETYLSSGYGLRLAIEERAVGWQRLGQMADVWQPGRTKGVLVGEKHGEPWLAATQIFDQRPIYRRWLAPEKIADASSLKVTPGMILVTRSGNVGRATLATLTLEGVLVSDDLLRVVPNDEAQSGWLYGYLRSTQARAMMRGVHYGHIIKHLEVGHLKGLPAPVVKPEIAAQFRDWKSQIEYDRNKAFTKSGEAEALFANALGSIGVSDWGETGFTISAARLFNGSRRLDAWRYNPGARQIEAHIHKKAKSVTLLRDSGYRIWIPNRYKRIEASDGVPYFDSSDLLEINPDCRKRFAECGFGDEFNGRVKPNWLLMPCSGQVYGIIGSVVLAGTAICDGAVSNHVLRMAPAGSGRRIREGFLATALSHPVFGRPLVKRLAFGSSVPEIDLGELKQFPVARFGETVEDRIAELAEDAAQLRADADLIERGMADEAGKLIDRFIAGDVAPFVVEMPAVSVRKSSASPSGPIPEHAIVRLKHGLKAAGLKVGAVGTVVHVYRAGAGYEVEFAGATTKSKVVTLEPADIEVVHD